MPTPWTRSPGRSRSTTSSWEWRFTTAKSWNNALDRFPEWPSIKLTVPNKRRETRFSLSWGSFPATLKAGVEAHLTSLGRIDLDNDLARPLRPATIAKRRKQLLWYLSALVKAGIDPAALVSLEDLVLPETAKRGYQYLLDRREGEKFKALADLAQFLPALAKRVGAPAAWIAELTRLKAKLKIEHTGMAERHLPTLRRFDDPAAVEALLALPGQIRDRVLALPEFGWREAKALQTAVAIEILIFAPVRISNLASIDVTRHLITVSNASKTVHLRFPADEVKNRLYLEFPLPEDTRELIELYRKAALPLLGERHSPFLFPGKIPGRPMTNAGLGQNIKQMVHRFTGLEMPPHRFRHAIGKIFLDQHPGQYEVVRRLLGHKNIATTIVFYAGAEGAAAARHYHQTILGLRGPAASTAKP